MPLFRWPQVPQGQKASAEDRRRLRIRYALPQAEPFAEQDRSCRAGSPKVGRVNFASAGWSYVLRNRSNSAKRKTATNEFTTEAITSFVSRYGSCCPSNTRSVSTSTALCR